MISCKWIKEQCFDPDKKVKSLQVLVILFVLFALFLLHYKSYNQYPTSKHTWAQSDWYSMSLGYLENNFDFFHPQTYQLNLQFPAKKELDQPQGITAANFPIHPFMVAWCMKHLNTTAPVVFRNYSLLLALIGLFFLYLTVVSLSKSRTVALGMVGFVLFHPVYAYYMNGFLPTFHALSTFFIALWCFVSYHKSHRKVYFILGTLLLTLAGLIRLPFAIHLIALFCTLVFVWYSKRKLLLFELVTTAIGLALFLTHFIYNHHLAVVYGSVFLNHTMFPTSIENFFNVLWWVIKVQAPNFLPLPQFFVFGLLIWLFLQKQSIKKLRQHDPFEMNFILIDLMGILSYTMIAWRQLWAHDYYYFDIFYVPIILILLFVLGLKLIRVNGQIKVMVAIFLISTLYIAHYSQRMLYAEPIAKSSGVEADFLNAQDFLEAEKVDNQARILILPFSDVGLPLTIMKRKGYVVRSNGKEELMQALNFPVDYVLVQNRNLSLVNELIPDFGKRLVFISTNSRITLFRPADL